MRSLLIVALVAGIPAAGSAQILECPPRPWPCPVPPPCQRGRPCIMPACGITSADVVRRSRAVRVGLVDRVLRSEITETYIYRGSRVAEVDLLFPLP